VAGGEVCDLRAQLRRQYGFLARDNRFGLDLRGMVQRKAGDGEQQHGHQAEGGTDPVPLMQLAQPDGAAHAGDG